MLIILAVLVIILILKMIDYNSDES